MRTILGLGLAALLVATAGAEDKKDAIDAKKLLGKWEPTGKDIPAGVKVVVEFAKEGKLNMEADLDGKKETKAGTYKLDGDKLTVTIDGDKAKTSTVLKLTDDTLEIKNESGKQTIFARLKAK